MSKFDKKCSKCKNYNGDILICESCAHYKPKLTVFDHITQSVETLAEKLVFDWPIVDREGQPIIVWFSNVTEGRYYSKSEALAATIEELKKEYKK